MDLDPCPSRTSRQEFTPERAPHSEISQCLARIEEPCAGSGRRLLCRIHGAWNVLHRVSLVGLTLSRIWPCDGLRVRQTVRHIAARSSCRIKTLLPSCLAQIAHNVFLSRGIAPIPSFLHCQGCTAQEWPLLSYQPKCIFPRVTSFTITKARSNRNQNPNQENKFKLTKPQRLMTLPSISASCPRSHLNSAALQPETNTCR